MGKHTHSGRYFERMHTTDLNYQIQSNKLSCKFYTHSNKCIRSKFTALSTTISGTKSESNYCGMRAKHIGSCRLSNISKEQSNKQFTCKRFPISDQRRSKKKLKLLIKYYFHVKLRFDFTLVSLSAKNRANR